MSETLKKLDVAGISSKKPALSNPENASVPWSSKESTLSRKAKSRHSSSSQSSKLSNFKNAPPKHLKRNCSCTLRFSTTTCTLGSFQLSSNLSPTLSLSIFAWTSVSRLTCHTCIHNFARQTSLWLLMGYNETTLCFKTTSSRLTCSKRPNKSLKYQTISSMSAKLSKCTTLPLESIKKCSMSSQVPIWHMFSKNWQQLFRPWHSLLPQKQAHQTLRNKPGRVSPQLPT